MASVKAGPGRRSLSPVSNRFSEKVQLQQLNERFSKYINGVKNMRDQLTQNYQADSSAHLNRIHMLEEEIADIQARYENEVLALREQIERVDRDRARAVMYQHKDSGLSAEYQNRILDLNAEVLQKDEEIRQLLLLLAQKDVDLQNARASVTTVSVQLDMNKKEVEELRRSVLEGQKKNDAEFSLRMVLQDHVQDLKNQLEFQNQTQARESQELRTRLEGSEALVLQLESKLRACNREDSVLVETVQKIREASEAELKRFQEEAETAYSQNLMDLKMYLQNDKVKLEQLQQENRYLHKQVDGLTAELNALESKRQYENSNNKTLIEKLEQEQEKSQQRIRALEARLEEMKDLLLAKMKELAEFQDVNISLRSEISALKTMLDEEEHQITQSHFQFPSNLLAAGSFSSAPVSLNTSPDTFPSLNSSPLSKSQYSSALMPVPLTTVAGSPKSHSPAKSAGPLRGKQEKKMARSISMELPKRPISGPPAISLDTNTLGKGQDYFTTLFKELKKEAMQPSAYESKERPSSAVSDYSTASSSAVGNVKIADVSSNGHYVRLLNCSPDIEEDIGGYILQQNIQGHPVAFYRFPPRTRMKAASTVTVWAAASKASHNPPLDLLWKEMHKFGTGTECTTILCKPNGQAIAWYTPRHWNRKFQQAWPETNSEPTDEALKSTQPFVPAKEESFAERKEKDMEPGKLELAYSTRVSPVPSKPFVDQSDEQAPILMKREKEMPSTFFSSHSPWCQSTASATHPDYCPGRSLPNNDDDGGSDWKQSKSHVTKASTPIDAFSTGCSGGKTTNSSKKSQVIGGKRSKGPTRSAGPNMGGVMYIGPPSPFASPLQRYYATSTYNIKLPSHASLTPSMVSN
ncbi:lamin tail domain-containing protein 1 isoform X2 [Protopterus annectens]|uniref:lamin tail domain-containing protein 1 isoform X2 n=1 Tax=Protopterus annectens TaxID=7888 RepID=UPI001CFAEEEA|nr:lamin tail domain-containing protein 1 isoform X2 [Protopterus annectens]